MIYKITLIYWIIWWVLIGYVNLVNTYGIKHVEEKELSKIKDILATGLIIGIALILGSLTFLIWRL